MRSAVSECGWAFSSVTAPWVAQRVWPIPVVGGVSATATRAPGRRAERAGAHRLAEEGEVADGPHGLDPPVVPRGRARPSRSRGTRASRAPQQQLLTGPGPDVSDDAAQSLVRPVLREGPPAGPGGAAAESVKTGFDAALPRPCRKLAARALRRRSLRPRGSGLPRPPWPPPTAPALPGSVDHDLHRHAVGLARAAHRGGALLEPGLAPHRARSLVDEPLHVRVDERLEHRIETRPVERGHGRPSRPPRCPISQQSTDDAGTRAG